MNKLTVTTALATALLASAPVLAHDRDWQESGWHESGWQEEGHWDYARVISATPLYREVRYSEPREVCHEEPVTERRVYGGVPDPAAILFGAAIGGVIGHQFGHGHGRDFGTAAGALIGAGHAAASSSWGHGRVVERQAYETSCRDVRETRYEQRIDGYDVTYRYHGRMYRTQLPYDPGSRVRVRVDVSPEDSDDLD